ncbi:hypothetical protein AU083_gp64 [Escherichia phage phi191]|uniref:Uncharacterized protein n=1 Tax=Escherichia phage phi191 TaxID=1458706 RepID=A0A096XES7_9CAUD|nr:hypothetical protein AU083_gp64 [Escherichia phage phi191]AHJ10660.1 hypothetical protein phi191_00064 [Escherichia phage phi191]
MSGFAQGLLAGFSTVDQAMTRRKELGLREAQLARQQKNNERDFEFAAVLSLNIIKTLISGTLITEPKLTTVIMH